MTVALDADAETPGDGHRFRAMFHDHGAVMLLIDPETGQIVDANPSAVAFYGYSMSELRSMSITEINMMPAAEVVAMMARAEAGDLTHFVFPHRLASGEIRRVDVHSSPIHDGRLLLFSIVVDIEDRVRAEEELARVSAYSRSLIEASLDPLVTISAVGVITDVNVATETVTGVPRRELIGSDFATYFTDPASARAGYVHAFNEGSVKNYPLAIRHVDGTVTDVLYNATVYRDSNGDIAGVFAAARDITERTRVEMELAEQRDRLAASEGLLRAVLDSTGDAVIRFGRDGRIDFVNHQVEQNSGVPCEHWIGKTFAEMGFGDFATSWDAYNRQVFDGGEALTFEFEIDNAEGHRWYETKVTPEMDADGCVGHVIESSRDITDRVQAESELRSSRAQLEQAQRIAHFGSWTLDNATNHVSWSEELFLMQGLDPASPAPDYTEHSRLFTAASWHELSTALSNAQTTGTPYELELEMVRPDGSHGWMLARGEPVWDEAGAIIGLQGVALDVTDRKVASERLRTQATHDPLTGLANRLALIDELTLAINARSRSGRPLAVLMMDLDRFKDVNDTLGHSAGDRLLIAVADRLQAVARAGDLVARLGGDEFIIVMRDLKEPAEAVRAAARLVEEFRTPFATSDRELFATASVGVALATDGAEAGDLLREADTALYAAKADGRDRVAMFNEDLRTTVTARLAVEAGLRQALLRGELEVWYQPEVDLKSGSVVAFEALLRWRRPDGDVWTADRFVEIAEGTGLILDIGDWMLNQACIQGAAWAMLGASHPVMLRVNISAVQLAEVGLLDAIDGALAASGLEPELLCVEITETALLRRTAVVTSNLQGIHDRGISLAIDDFGTGYASLTYLDQHPIDVIKIDRSFVAHATDDGPGLVAGIIALARPLGIQIVAEGVEHADQVARLCQMGCGSAQGWFYSRAVCPDEATRLLSHRYPGF
ncbi:MAG: EAL domain-containing protein [Actinobacteria bacterium]|nr:EAL domain-containing protein [Actinomycetota bacterium]